MAAKWLLNQLSFIVSARRQAYFRVLSGRPKLARRPGQQRDERERRSRVAYPIGPAKITLARALITASGGSCLRSLYHCWVASGT